MTAKQKSITAVVVLAVVFLAGFGPQYLEKRRIQSASSTAGNTSSHKYTGWANVS